MSFRITIILIILSYTVLQNLFSKMCFLMGTTDKII